MNTKKIRLALGGFLLFPIVAFSQVPSSFEGLYSFLEGKLHIADSMVNNKWSKINYCSDYYVDLKYANTTTYKTKLLDPIQLYRAKKAIDAYDSLGIHGIRIHTGYPFLVENFPNSDKYLDFFIEVNRYARSKGLEVFVKSAITPNNENYGAIDETVYNFMNNKTRSEYLSEKLQMLQLVIDSLQPDYLTLENEPETMESGSGLTFSFAPDSVKDMLQYYTQNLTNPNNIPLGAGAGNWENIEYFDKIGQVSGIDFIDVHIYPVLFDYLSKRIYQICDTIQHYNKDIVFGENWLHKQNISDVIAKTPPVEVFKRDYFSFWQPLDSTFNHVLSKISKLYQAEMITMWNPDRYFYYLPYQQGMEDSSGAYLGSLTFQPTNQNILNYKFTPIAYQYKNLADSACDDKVGVNKINNSNRLTIYPNPTHSNLFIRKPNYKTVRSISIFNTKGKLVFSQNNLNTTSIDVSNLKKGFYFIKVEFTDSSVSTGKIVKI